MNLDFAGIGPEIWRLLLDLIIGGVAGYLVYYVARGLEEDKKNAEIANLRRQLEALNAWLPDRDAPPRPALDPATKEGIPGALESLGWSPESDVPGASGNQGILPQGAHKRQDILNPIFVSVLVLAILAGRVIFNLDARLILTFLGLLFITGLLVTWYKNR